MLHCGVITLIKDTKGRRSQPTSLVVANLDAQGLIPYNPDQKKQLLILLFEFPFLHQR
jgi:hypothetical protein